MPLFLVKYTLLADKRAECMSKFGRMTEADDASDVGSGVVLLGRWSTVGEGMGYCVHRGRADDLCRWLVKWSVVATIRVTPVLDDACARAAILHDPMPQPIAPRRASPLPRRGSISSRWSTSSLRTRAARGTSSSPT